jgi:preprotein translocase subunit SecF
MSFYSRFYEKNYKLYLIVPAIILLLSLIFIFGFGVKKGIDLKGGTLISIYDVGSVNTDDIKLDLENNFGLEDVSVIYNSGITKRLDIQYLEQKSLIDLKTKINNIKQISNKDSAIEEIKKLFEENSYNYDLSVLKNYNNWVQELDSFYTYTKNNNTTEILTFLNSEYGIDSENVNIKEISATLGASFYSKAILIGIIAIVGIIILILIAFGEFIPALTIIVCAILDVLGGLAGLAIVGIPLSLTTIPALLMLLGYSIDTDIMLTTKLLKRKEGHAKERAGDALRTGSIMTTTTLGALFVMLIFSYLYNINVLFDISIVLVFGLVVDLLATWFMNGPILLWYLENKKVK